MDGRGGGDQKNTARNFKSLRGIVKNATFLKRNDEACKGILIAPSKLPRIFVRLRLLALELYREDKISLGRAAELGFPNRRRAEHTP